MVMAPHDPNLFQKIKNSWCKDVEMAKLITKIKDQLNDKKG